MPRVIVLPSQEDQLEFENGEKPNNHYDHTFETTKELDRYVEGMEALDDLVEYEIVHEKELKLTVKLDRERIKRSFKTVAEKDAFKLGLEDGDGWKRPQIIREDDLEFEEIVALIDVSPAPSV